MSWFTRVSIFTLIPFGILILVDPDWPSSAWWCVIGFNILGYAEGILDR